MPVNKSFRRPTLAEYFDTVAWKDLYGKLQEQRPLIMIFVDKTGEVKQVIVKEPSVASFSSAMVRADQLDIKAKQILEHVIENSQDLMPGAAPVEPAEILDAPPPLPLPFAEKPLPSVIGPAPDVAPVPVPPAAAPAPAKDALSEEEGNVAVGRSVEFSFNGRTEQGKISWISTDEKEFLIKKRDGKSVIVPPESLKSLLPFSVGG